MLGRARARRCKKKMQKNIDPSSIQRKTPTHTYLLFLKRQPPLACAYRPNFSASRCPICQNRGLNGTMIKVQMDFSITRSYAHLTHVFVKALDRSYIDSALDADSPMAPISTSCSTCSCAGSPAEACSSTCGRSKS